jgi:hypothetical protein
VLEVLSVSRLLRYQTWFVNGIFWTEIDTCLWKNFMILNTFKFEIVLKLIKLIEKCLQLSLLILTEQYSNETSSVLE